MCVIQGTSQTGSIKNVPFHTEYCWYFFCTKVPWGPPEGTWLRHSVSVTLTHFREVQSLSRLLSYRAFYFPSITAVVCVSVRAVHVDTSVVHLLFMIDWHGCLYSAIQPNNTRDLFKQKAHKCFCKNEKWEELMPVWESIYLNPCEKFSLSPPLLSSHTQSHLNTHLHTRSLARIPQLCVWTALLWHPINVCDSLPSQLLGRPGSVVPSHVRALCWVLSYTGSMQRGSFNT